VIHAHDPQGMAEAKKQLPGEVRYFTNVYEAIQDADAIILMTEWNEYRGLDFDRLKQDMRGNTFVDLRNVYEKAHLMGLGFNYTCVGR
jgi:UDPglucose 6-dehydrogenase